MSVWSRFLWKSTRHATRGFRKRPIATTLGLGATALTGIGVMAMMPGNLFSASAAVAAAPAVTATDVDSLLDARSPGGRRYGWLLDTKIARGYADKSPTERILSSVRHRLETTSPDQPQLVDTPAVPFGDPVTAATGDGDPIVGTGTPGAGGGPGGFVGTPGAGGVLPGSGGNGSGSDGGGTSTTPIASPVPEPSGWTLMILGFAFLGTAMRRQRPAFSRLGAQ